MSVTPKTPIQVALDELEAIDFIPYLTQHEVTGKWILAWRKKGSVWKTESSSLDALADKVAGWLRSRHRGDGKEEQYAEMVKDFRG